MRTQHTSRLPANQSQGFTLVEVLVTLVVFSILSMAGITVLSQGIAAQEQVGRVNENVSQLRRTHALLKADLGQLVPRSTRDRFGGDSNTLFAGGVSIGTQAVLQFVRDGWENPSGLERRGSLQKVEYLVEDDVLVRRAYLHPDVGSDDQALDLVLLTGVTSVELSFYVRGQWYDAWVVATDGNGVLPTAVALELETVELGDVRQVFLTSGLSS